MPYLWYRQRIRGKMYQAIVGYQCDHCHRRTYCTDPTNEEAVGAWISQIKWRVFEAKEDTLSQYGTAKKGEAVCLCTECGKDEKNHPRPTSM